MEINTTTSALKSTSEAISQLPASLQNPVVPSDIQSEPTPEILTVSSTSETSSFSVKRDVISGSFTNEDDSASKRRSIEVPEAPKDHKSSMSIFYGLRNR